MIGPVAAAPPSVMALVPVLTEEAREDVGRLQVLRELNGHGHFTELRSLNPDEALSALLRSHTEEHNVQCKEGKRNKTKGKRDKKHENLTDGMKTEEKRAREMTRQKKK